MSDSVQILDPTVGDEAGTSLPRAPRLGEIEGATLGLVSNGKTHSQKILARIADNLEAKYRIGGRRELRKPSPGRPVDEDQLQMVAEHAMAVIAAIGD